jgi:Mrp family chromosome partitioning ATPase
MDAEVSATTSRLEMEQATYDSQIQSIEGNLSLLRSTAAQTNNDTIALQGLERNASALGQVYESLLRQRQDLLDRAKSAEPDIRLLAFAEVPVRATSFNRLYLFPPALIAFLLFGCMIALTVERLDHTLHGERETAEALGVPCVGILPRLTTYEQKSIFRLLAESPRAPYSKAIRHIFIGTAPQFRNDPDHKIVLITSSVPGEEKTNLAWSLALSAAQLRWSVLVVEAGHQAASLRSHALKLMERPSSVHPLADVMANHRPLTSAIRPVGTSSIGFLSLGADADLLNVITDPAFAGVLSQIRDAYDLVIVDAPSVFDSSEARLLVNKVDKVLFAVRWGKTPREMAARAVEMIRARAHHDSSGIDKIVSILTTVDIQQHARYRFADQGDFLTMNS